MSQPVTRSIGRFEMIETIFLHERGNLRAETARARGFVHDDAAAGLLHGRRDRLDVERHERAQVDHFGVDAAVVRAASATCTIVP